jgi:hypothetical protein
MARTAVETASILSDLFDETFYQDYSEPFRITWPQLRSLSGVPRLNDNYLRDVNAVLSGGEKFLIPLNNSLAIARELNLEHFRMVPDRTLEEYLPDEAIKTEESDEDDIVL